jgi:glycosyltransferase involved in cell wall biosynthesis
MVQDEAEIVAEHWRHQDSAVTVAVSLYNYRDYVLSCLESAKAQTISDLDLIVVDDHSADGGKDVVTRWVEENNERFGRCTLVRHMENRGLAAARNTAFARARTQYVFVCDADNLLYPRCLQQLAGALDRTGASFAYCHLEKFGAMSGLESIHSWNPASLHKGNKIDGMVLLRRSVWHAVGGYSDDMPVMGWEDFDLWFKIARLKGWGVQVPEILARYRVHMDSMIHSVTNPSADRLWDYLRARHSEFFGVQ